MLVFDDNMLKLAKMQETLLKATAKNRQENLEKYKNIVIEIDKQAFSSLLEEIKQVNNHNQTLEDELEFMEMIGKYYNQLYELQLGFKKVCELYDDNELKLSDLSQIDIDYINNRKNIIEGYLINLKNIETNKQKLEKLNEALIEEEKNKMHLSKRLLDYEEALRNNFINAEGRIVVDGNLQYVSVVTEYKKIDYDFKLLIDNKNALDELLSIVSDERTEIDEKYKTAEICYNSNPSSGSKIILDDISKEFFNVRYRLTMLKILKLLSDDYDNYEQFKEKREKLIDLIKYREICLKNLGEHISIDPFSRTKIDEQLKSTSLFIDNSKKINKVKKEILELSNLIEEKIAENKDYRIDLNETKDLIIDTVSMHDIVSLVDMKDDERIYIEEQRVSNNQVVSIKDIADKFNMSKAKQKTSSVIKRVNQMMTIKVEAKPKKKIEIVNPELIIVNQPLNIEDNFLEENIQNTNEVVENDMLLGMSLMENTFRPEEPVEENPENDFLEENTKNTNEVVENDILLGMPLMESTLIPEESVEETTENDLKEEDIIEQEEIIEFEDEPSNQNIISNNYNSSIFETINPFEPMPLFIDRTDDDTSILDKKISTEQIEDSKEDLKEVKLENNEENESNLEENSIENDVTKAFWITQSDNTDKTDNNLEEDILSFDDQINALISNEENTKIKKLVA